MCFLKRVLAVEGKKKDKTYIMCRGTIFLCLNDTAYEIE